MSEKTETTVVIPDRESGRTVAHLAGNVLIIGQHGESAKMSVETFWKIAEAVRSHQRAKVATEAVAS